MTNEEKQLLIIDLCGRLPYGVKLLCANGEVVTLVNPPIAIQDDCWDFKPYLRPMSSMTEREKEVFQYIAGGKILDNCNCIVRNGFGLYYDNIAKIGDWLNEHHFDWRGLIPMGLALEAPDDMYK